jgi:hypothetical protein
MMLGTAPATDQLLDACSRHEMLIARVEQATGRPTNIPRVKHSAHEALGVLGITATVALEVPPAADLPGPSPQPPTTNSPPADIIAGTN